MRTYQNHPMSAGTSLESPERSFADALSSIARQLYFSTPRKSEAEANLLQDVRRGRFPMKTVERMARIAALSTRPEHREAFAELIREYSTPRVGCLSVAAAFDAETEAQGLADLEQRRFERERTRANQERVLERLHAQEIATREAITAVRRVAVQ